MHTTVENQGLIQELPEFVVNQIKAGEVIERPSQLFKEVIENSIDALSKNIHIKIRNNGLDLIQIKDDGNGIKFDELPLAFKRHATSKISNFSDIYEIYSYGFRGEALASISAVSKISCQSRSYLEQEGGEILIEGGEIKEHQTARVQDQGTVLNIKDLFYNTPVRLKFLKSQNAEKRAIQNILECFLISWPQISFTIQWDDEEVQSFPKCDNPKDRILSVMFKRKQQQDQVLLLNEEHDEVQVKAYFSPTASRGGYKKQYIFVNGRYLIDKSLHYFVVNSMQSVWGPGQTGHYFVMISIPSDQIDVNIHPSKTQIKFEDDSVLLSLLSKGIRTFAPRVTESKEDDSQPQFAEVSTPANGHYQGSSSSQPLNRPTSSGNQVIRSFRPSEESIEVPIVEASQDFFMIRANEEIKTPKIIHKTRFLNWYLKNYLANEKYQSVPLIISDPLPNKNFDQNALNYLADKYQIEIEPLDEQMALLRSIPYSLTKLPYQIIIKEIIEKFTPCEPINFDTLNLSVIKESFFAHQFSGVLTDYDIQVDGQNFCLEMTDDLFHS
jgi:DNA mismatch repair protein MutL